MLGSKGLNNTLRAMSLCGVFGMLVFVTGCPILPPDPCAGVTCDDTDSCTTDTCDAGDCVFTPVDCTDQVCNPADGVCVDCVADTDCTDDGLFCTGAETCGADNTCGSAGDPCDAATEVCNDDTDVCDTPCTTDADCVDTDLCNGAETCGTDGLCVAGTPVVCVDDGEFCNGAESCGAATGLCGSAGDPCAAGETCDEDNDDCMTVTTCSDNTDCDDSDLCTTDSCGADMFCAFVALDCSDGDLCTDDVCTDGVCSNPAVVCGAGESCVGGTCLATGSFTLTVDDDAITGTAGNDVFTAAIGTLNPGDIVVGSGGTDTMNATVAGTASSLATLIDIDNLNLTTLNATMFDAANAAAIGAVNLVSGSTGALAWNNGEPDTTFSLGNGFAKRVTVDLSAPAGTDVLNFTLNGTAKGAGIATTDPGVIASIDVDVVADSWLSAVAPGTSFFSTAAVNLVNVTGSGRLWMHGGDPTDMAADSIDMSAFTGPVSVSPVPGANATFNFAAGGLDFPGVDEYIINDVAAFNHQVTLGTTGTNMTLDISQIAAAASAGTFTMIFGASGNANTLNINLGGAGDGMAAITGTGGTGVDVINLDSGGTTANDVATGSTIGTASFPLPPKTTNVTGDQNLDLNTFTSDIISAPTFTGNLTVTGSGTANVITGGSGLDVINGGAGDDIIDGGGGADTVTGDGGADELTGGTGADTFNFPLIADVTAGTPDEIKDFEEGASADVLAVNATSFGINAGTGDEIIDGWESVAQAAHNKDSEITVITTAVVGALTSGNAATAIGNATAAYANGDVKLFVVSNGTDSAVFRFLSAAADATVITAELGAGPIIQLTGMDSTELGDLVAANFAFGAS